MRVHACAWGHGYKLASYISEIVDYFIVDVYTLISEVKLALKLLRLVKLTKK